MIKTEENNDILCLHLKGEFFFTGNTLSNFKGPIKKGLRLVLWGISEKRATSCVFVKNIDLTKGKVDTEIIILSALSIDKKITRGEVYSIGIPGIQLAYFKVENILGQWTEEIPRMD